MEVHASGPQVDAVWERVSLTTVGQRLARTHGSGGCLNDLTQAEIVVMGYIQAPACSGMDRLVAHDPLDAEMYLPHCLH